MIDLSNDFIRRHIADSAIIFQRGVQIYQHGSFTLEESRPEEGLFLYTIDGNYGDYTTRIQFNDETVETSCNCPYPGNGCKHTVAALLDARDIVERWRSVAESAVAEDTPEPYLAPEEIKALALEDRKKRARSETFSVTEGDMFKGEHLVTNTQGKSYTVTLHDPEQGKGHCTCPDYLTNRLGTCKHLLFLWSHFKKRRGFKARIAREKFPYVDLFWDSESQHPMLFSELSSHRIKDVSVLMQRHFDTDGRFKGQDLTDLMPFIDAVGRDKRFRVQDSVLDHMNLTLQHRHLNEMEKGLTEPAIDLKTQLYPYQQQGVAFCALKTSALIGDEMGLGKTLQAIGTAMVKKEVFGFTKVLIITLASLKEQWKREIHRFSNETAAVISGNPEQRRTAYMEASSFFKITNYEAVLRDVTIIARFKPDLVILDEAQRIKNFTTKTADAVKQIPRKHALVLTGTPLENKLEDVYSIVQFLDPYMLSPLWRFAADHFMLSRNKKGKIVGYRNLEQLHRQLQAIVIRRKKEDVLSELPKEVVNNYYLDLHEKQQKIHSGYLQSLLPLLNKKFLTPMDLRRIQELLMRMRMVCDSTYLIDRKSHISPKLNELEGIVHEMVIENRRKMIIFSEWTTMTFLIARQLSNAGIGFVELSGKVPVKKRQHLIDEFTHNPECRVFLSTDAGGTGLNLQAADCVVNFELPWNPARMNQRIGRANRIGQKSRCVNVVNLITKDSIEEKICAGLQLKTELFEGVFDGKTDVVEFSHEKRTEMINRLREMMGTEPLLPPQESREQEEIPEDTPHYLNPEAFKREPDELNVIGEEHQAAPLETESNAPAADAPQRRGGDILNQQPPEKIEAVLNAGMQFLGGLMEMATGRKISAGDPSGQMVHIDRDTGEVTLKFRLPDL